MSLKFKRNSYIVLGLLLMTIIQILIVIPYLNYLFGILCFKKAYDIHQEIHSEHVCSNL